MKPCVLATAACAALLAALQSGCHGYLLPYDDTPLPARSKLTCGGDELMAKAGELSLRPGPLDMGARLGVSLTGEAGVVVVTGRLRADAALEPGDRIVHAAAALPPVPETEPAKRPDARRGLVLSRAQADEKRSAGSKAEPPPVPEDISALRTLPHGHPVRSVEDLAGYAVGEGWLALDLGVSRDGKEIVVRQKLAGEPSWVPFRRWDPRSAFRRNGIELCSLMDWPAANLPRGAEPGDHLVTRIDVGSRAARAGLRPLDIVTNAEKFEKTGIAIIRSPDGELKRIRVQAPPEGADHWIPFVISIEGDGAREHEGLGPLDLLSHYSWKQEYDPATDSYRTVNRWSIASTLGWTSEDGAGSFWLLPLFDPPRLNYIADFAETSIPARRDRPYRWGETQELEEFLGAE